MIDLGDIRMIDLDSVRKFVTDHLSFAEAFKGPTISPPNIYRNMIISLNKIGTAL